MKLAFFIFLALYAGALCLLLVGTFGWFGQDQDPLSAVFLIPLGLPWNVIIDKLGFTSAFIAAASPAINLGILFWLWKR